MFDQSVVYLLMGILTIGSVVYLLICVDPNTKGLIGIVRKLVIETLPKYIRKGGVAIFGHRFNRFMDGFFRYIFKSNNPIVMVLYICVGPGGYVAYLKYGYYDHMPNTYVSHLHLYPTILIAGFGFYCYYKAVNTDPGVITKQNVRQYLEKYDQFDEVMFQRDNVCSTCNVKKPARSKHSSVTNQCVARFDHYCIWIKGDVGERNYKYFLGFIGMHAVLTMYGTYFGLAVLNGLVTKEGLWHAKFRSIETGEIFTAGYMTIFQHLLNRMPVFVFLVLLCIVMCISLTLFFLYHMYLVKLGFTTNEKVKKSCLEDDLEESVKRLKRSIGDIPDINSEANKAKYLEIKMDIVSNQEKLENLQKLSYSRGFLKNLWTIIES